MAESLNGDGAQTMLGFLATMRSDPEVGDVFRETMIAGMHEHLQGAAGRRARRRLPRPRPARDRRPGDPRLPAAICGQPMDAEAMADRLTELLFAPLPPLD